MELSNNCLGAFIVLLSLFCGIAGSGFGNFCLSATLFTIGCCILLVAGAERINRN